MNTEERAEYLDSWNSYGYREFIIELARKFRLNDSTLRVLHRVSEDRMRLWFESLLPCGSWIEPDSGGLSVEYLNAVDVCSRADMASFLRSLRSK